MLGWSSRRRPAGCWRPTFYFPPITLSRRYGFVNVLIRLVPVHHDTPGSPVELRTNVQNVRIASAGSPCIGIYATTKVSQDNLRSLHVTWCSRIGIAHAQRARYLSRASESIDGSSSSSTHKVPQYRLGLILSHSLSIFETSIRRSVRGSQPYRRPTSDQLRVTTSIVHGRSPRASTARFLWAHRFKLKFKMLCRDEVLTYALSHPSSADVAHGKTGTLARRSPYLDARRSRQQAQE